LVGDLHLHKTFEPVLLAYTYEHVYMQSLHPNSLSFEDGQSFLEAQDRLYTAQRAPFKTEPEKEGRTFVFRVSTLGELAPLQAMLDWAVETWWNSPMSPCGDADVKVTLKPDTLKLEELRFLMGLLEGSERAVQTLAVSSDYSGICLHIPAELLGTKVPGSPALRCASEGLAQYCIGLEQQARRAQRADELIWGHLPLDWQG
jgi:hypothetical protein